MLTLSWHSWGTNDDASPSLPLVESTIEVESTKKKKKKNEDGEQMFVNLSRFSTFPYKFSTGKRLSFGFLFFFPFGRTHAWRPMHNDYVEWMMVPT